MIEGYFFSNIHILCDFNKEQNHDCWDQDIMPDVIGSGDLVLLTCTLKTTKVTHPSVMISASISLWTSSIQNHIVQMQNGNDNWN